MCSHMEKSMIGIGNMGGRICPLRQLKTRISMLNKDEITEVTLFLCILLYGRHFKNMPAS